VATAEIGSSALRPADIASRRFAVAKKGYEPDQVHAFLNQVSEQLSRMQGEIEWQRARCEHLELRTAGAQQAAYARVSREFMDVARKADEAACKVRTDAEHEIRAALNAAREEAAAIVANSGRQAKRILAQASLEAERMVADAADSVKRLVWEARQPPQPAAEAPPEPVEAKSPPVVEGPPPPVIEDTPKPVAEPRTAVWSARAALVWEAPVPTPPVITPLPDSEADQSSDVAVADEAPAPQLPGTEEPEFEVPELVDLAELWEAVPSTHEQTVDMGQTFKPPAVHTTAPENLDVSIDVSFFDLFEDTAE
jgi:DivIVA domain-containing protein